MNNKLITLVLTLVVGIILTASILVPVINDASTKDVSSANRYTYRMSELGDSSMTLSYDETDKALINGEHPVVANAEGTVQTILCVITNNAAIVSYGIQWYYYFVDTDGNYRYFNTNHALLTSTTATFENGVATITYDGTGYTFDYDWVYFPDPDGVYVYTKPTYGAYVNADDQVISFSVGASNNGVSIGTVDGLTCQYHATDGTKDTDTFEPAITVADAEMGLSTIKEIVSATPEDIIIPYEYQYKAEASGGVYSLYQAIPVLIIISLLLAAVGIVVRGRNA